MDVLLPYMQQQRSPMANYMFAKLVIPLMNGDIPSPELLDTYATLFSRAQNDLSFQYAIFGKTMPGLSADLNFTNPAMYAVVRAFSFQGDWVFKFKEQDLPPEWLERIRIDKNHVVQLFLTAAVGAPEALLGKAQLDLNAEDFWWTRLCKVDKASFLLRGTMKKQYADYKAIFWAMCKLMRTYLESNSFLTVLSILCLCSTFNIYNKVSWLNKDFENMQKYVARLNVDINEGKLAAVGGDPKYIDQAVLQILRDKEGGKYQSVIKRLEFSSMFPETIESLLSESLL